MFRLRSAGRQATFAMALTACASAHGAEVCRFHGTTDYAGHVTLVTTASGAGSAKRIDVALQFEATTSLFLHIRYLFEEISEWRDGALTRVDANTRYLFAGHVVRQQWDDFQQTAGGFRAMRIEGKHPDEFRRQFPHFAVHWDLASFGRPWLDDFAGAAPIRRKDLDLPAGAASAPVQAPFALAFYWARFLPHKPQEATVFLPGFKVDKLATITLSPAPVSGGLNWHGGLHHAWLSPAPASTANAALSPDGHLQRLSFMLHGAAGSAGGVLHADGCEGSVGP